MKPQILMVIFALLGACESSTNTNNDGFKPDPVIHSLPSSQPGEALCGEVEKVDLVGGDLMASADRIVVGTVTKVEVVDEFAPASLPCDSKTISWTLRVTLQVDENLKGTGSEAGNFHDIAVTVVAGHSTVAGRMAHV
ncbi:MAG: hypothetical protein R3E66_00315 [bacterium]